MKYVLRAAGVVTAAVLALGAWAIFFGDDDSGFLIRNDTGRTVRVEVCSQHRPAFPGAFDIGPHRAKRMQGDWLPTEDPGAACYLTGVPHAGDSGATGASAFHACLKMPTHDDARDSFKVSEGDRSLTRTQCLALSSPGFP